MDKLIDGVILTSLKQICHPKGNIYHALKSSDNGFESFGEAYFSTVNCNDIKGWKKHTEMVLNLVVPIGEIEFVLYDDRENSSTYKKFFSVKLSKDNYKRLTIPSGIWMAFKGYGSELNMLLNIASIEHNPSESISKELEEIKYDW